ncbi:hypothetical protein KEF29_11565 [Streptomyces tuirus]|uniref:HEAT repeat domain-containing protein n=1 Tax=Streptomyces tuirus TaxID=68278 RepID=A0A941J580_9ACTN|nr:hypothetical protein [Streptomyces tuirus]
MAWALVAHLEADPQHTWRTRDALHGLTQALPDVRRLADDSPAGEVRAAALSLLDGDDASDGQARHDVRRFVRSLDDPHEAVRYEAVLGLERWVEANGSLPPDSEHARAGLAALTANPSPRLRQAATGLLEALDSGPGI